MKDPVMATETRVTGERGAGRIKAFVSNQSGVAAIEFALLVPIMLGLYFMLNETSNGLRAARKTTMVARIMADLATRPSNISDADKNDIFASAAPILSPFPADKGSYRLTSIRFDALGKGSVDWSEVYGSGIGSAHARCTPTETRPTQPGLIPLSVPAGLKVPNTSVVLAEALVKYTPIVGYNITGEINLKDQLYMRPRTTDFVTRNGVTGAACVY
jgi:Flp pilus assembly protein TadG